MRKSLLFLLSSCILLSCESAYDLNKEINKEVSIGGDKFAFPIGTSEKILANKLLSITDESALITSENGDYSIIMKDKIKPTSFFVPNISINHTSITGKPLNFSSVTTRAIKTIDFKLTEPLLFLIEGNMPNEITTASSATFKKDENGNYPYLNLTINLSGFPSDINSITTSYITLDLPKSLTYKPNSEINDNKLVTSGKIDLIDGAGQYTKTIYVTGGNLTDNHTIITDANGYKTMRIEQPLDLKGQISIESPSNIDSDILNLKGEPIVEFSGAEIHNFHGVIDVKVDPIEYYYTTEFPKFMSDPHTYLDLLNSSLSITASTNSPIGVIANTNIKALKNNTYIDNSDINLDININPSTINSEMTDSRYWISNNNSGMPESYTWVDRNTANLLINVPDQINISVNPQSSTTPGTIELGKDYQVKVNYELLIPLMLGEKLNINYNEEFKNLQENISKIINKASELIVDIETTNLVPLALTIFPTPLDIDGNKIQGLEISIDGDVKSAEKDVTNKITGTKEVKSNSTLIIKETSQGALKTLSSIQLNIKAKSNTQTKGAMLNKNQYIILSMKAIVPGGLTFN